ncbi:MAG: O-antigen ligase family protein, partial [Alphaproteobacteria bacterium]|nr:O-antigen ligase family protein [Alphaproteobacteria bacterium]
FWSPFPLPDSEQILQFLLILLPFLVLIYYTKHATPLVTQKAARIIYWSFLIAIPLFAVEMFFGQPVYRACLYILSFAPDGTFGSGELDTREIHRAAAVISVMIFLMAAQFAKNGHRRYALIFLLIWLLLTYFSPSQSAFAGTLIGILATGFAFLQKKLTYYILVLGLAAGFIFAVPFSVLNYKTNFAEKYLNKGIMKEAHIVSRSETYYGISKQILKKPVFGHGLEASRSVKSLVDEKTGKRLFFSLHPHNFILQILFETGYVGGFLFWVVFCLMLMKIRQYDTSLQPFMYGTISSVAVISLFAFGFWQTWWLAGLGIVIIAFMQKLYISPTDMRPTNKPQSDEIEV